MLQLGAEVHGILLWPLGGLAFMGHSVSPRDDIVVAIAGPATHIPQVSEALQSPNRVLYAANEMEYVFTENVPT